MHGLTADLPLAQATLLDLRGRTMHRHTSVPATAAHARRQPKPCKLAAELGRLGEFRLDAPLVAHSRRWPATGRDPAQDAAGSGGRPAPGRRASRPTARARTAFARRSRRRRAARLPGKPASCMHRWPTGSASGALKWELEDLAFRELNPAEYQQIAGALNEKRARPRALHRGCLPRARRGTAPRPA